MAEFSESGEEDLGCVQENSGSGEDEAEGCTDRSGDPPASAVDSFPLKVGDVVEGKEALLSIIRGHALKLQFRVVIHSSLKHNPPNMSITCSRAGKPQETERDKQVCARHA